METGETGQDFLAKEIFLSHQHWMNPYSFMKLGERTLKQKDINWSEQKILSFFWKI